jgi:hypothetical protein
MVPPIQVKINEWEKALKTGVIITMMIIGHTHGKTIQLVCSNGYYC